MSETTANTPLIQQYLDIKARHPDSILFFRVGDFYEMFFDDAREGSRLLGITLTSRNNGAAAGVPLAGVPAKAVGEYLPRLVREGRKVAICEQVEDASEAEGIVRREVTEVVTPGATLEDALLVEGRNNFVAVIAGDDPVGVATADLSTGEFEVVECDRAALPDELARLEPAELVVAAEAPAPPTGKWVVTRREGWRFDPQFAVETLRRHYGVLDVEGFGFRAGEDAHLLAAAGAAVAYLEEVRPAGVRHLRTPRVERTGGAVHLDEMTRRNLEIVEPLRGEGGGTLLEVVDRTLTPMGRRLLRRRLLRPLVDRGRIESRLDAVEGFVRSPVARRSLRKLLKGMGDLERQAAKIATGRIQPRELLALADSLGRLPDVVSVVERAAGGEQAEGGPPAPAGAAETVLAGLVAELDCLGDVRERILVAIDPDAPPSVAGGGVIRAGHSAELDELRALRDGAVEWIAGLQRSERERTGIESLKIGFNKVFGYYIEVTKPNLPKVPDDYQRKQTLANAERYVTPELKEWEEKVVDAEERIAHLEARLFRELRDSLAREVPRLQATSARVAELDVSAGLADLAERDGYVRPQLTEEFGLDIRAGRHPVVERLHSREEFIPNDVCLDEETYVMVLTGPNMAGKSTLLRQVGLIVLLAQVGSFVPAGSARIGICDRIFTRVGASDSLARGQSTFMVEMTETATILNGASRRSLVLLDEIGRGTSTYDGVAIAWAVTEYIHDRIGARTIFATHYHELVELADSLPGVGAFNVAVREAGGQVVFLRRLEPGGCDRSYGVHVARLAGVPREVVERAAIVLHELEEGTQGGSRLSCLPDRERGQLSLFRPPPSVLRERLSELEPNHMTPIEALAALAELKRLSREEA